MNTRLFATFALAMLFSASAAASPLGTAFTYQGMLAFQGEPASGPFDFRFRLYDQQASGLTVGPVVRIDDLPISSGLVVASLDFGLEPFAGDALWLEIEVRDGTSDGTYQRLSPRQPISPVPYALHAEFVAAGTVGASEINPDEVQLRVGTQCGPGTFLSAINDDGTAVCTAESAIGPVSSDDIIDGTIATADLGSDVVTQRVLADNAVGLEQMDTAAVGSDQLIDGAVTAAKLAADSVTAEQIADGTVGTADLAENSVTGSQIEQRAVRGEHIARRAVAGDHIDQNEVQRRVTSSCAIGSYLVGIEASGEPICEDVVGPAAVEHFVGMRGGLDGIVRDDGRPLLAVISLLDNLVVVDCHDAPCSSYTSHLAASGTFVSDVAIRQRPSGNPVIAFADTANDDVLLYRCSNPDCSSGSARTLETTGHVGRALSMEVTPAGLPIISYADDTNDQARVFVCANTDCTTGDGVAITAPGFANAINATAVAIRDNGRAYVAVGIDKGSADSGVILYDCESDDCRFGTVVQIENQLNVDVLDIVLTSDDEPVLAWMIGRTAFTLPTLWALWCDDGSCGDDTRRKLWAGSFVRDIDIAMISGKPWIVAADATRSRIAGYRCDDRGCVSGHEYAIDYYDAPSNRESPVLLHHRGNSKIVYETIVNKLRVLSCDNPLCY